MNTGKTTVPRLKQRNTSAGTTDLVAINNSCIAIFVYYIFEPLNHNKNIEMSNKLF